MKQYNFINFIISSLTEIDYLNFAFIEGEFKRKTEDEYSSLELYLSSKIDANEFESKVLDLVNNYKKIIYLKKQNDKIKFIYYDNLIVTINFINPNELNNFDYNNDILVLFDPNNYLDNFVNYSLCFTNKELGCLIDEVSSLTLDFIKFYLRNDLGLMISYSIKIFDAYSKILHCYKEPYKAKLGINEILSTLSIDERIKYVDIIKKMNSSSCKEGVILMLKSILDIIAMLPISVNSYYDYDLFMYVFSYIKKV